MSLLSDIFGNTPKSSRPLTPISTNKPPSVAGSDKKSVGGGFESPEMATPKLGSPPVTPFLAQRRGLYVVIGLVGRAFNSCVALS
jgi:hypothetical protein